MSCRLWLMLILIIFQLKLKIMGFHYIENCFYEKRLNTFLHSYNDLHDRWISEFDCFTRCLKTDPKKCRSFEYWHQSQHGLCIRANISLKDYSSIIGHNQFVDYYEIDCRETSQAIQPSTINCSDNELDLIVILNDINPEYISLGNELCKPIWSNKTHAKFLINIENCSLILTNDSIVGKLHWEIFSEETSSIKKYERFFICRNNNNNRRLNHHPTSTQSNSRNIFSILPYQDEHRMTSSYRITLEWTLQNQTYFCPNSCFISLYSFINITLGDLSLISSKFLIDSCDLIALPPYTNYVQSRRLIYQGCSIDPTVIHIPKASSPLSIFHFSFYLYHILKEPIPFEIQCKILQHNEQIKFQHNIDCSSSSLTDNNHYSININNKRDHSYTLFRSLSIYVTRQIPLIQYHQQEKFSNQHSMISIATVHYIECSRNAFFVLILLYII